MSAYEKVLLARAKDRPTGISYIENIFEDFIELHGDRRFADDPAIVGGIATLHGRPSPSSPWRRARTCGSACAATLAPPTPRATARPCA